MFFPSIYTLHIGHTLSYRCYGTIWPPYQSFPSAPVNYPTRSQWMQNTHRPQDDYPTQTVYRPSTSAESFKMKFINKRITKCQGCKRKLREEQDDLTLPPHDPVVARMEKHALRFWRWLSQASYIQCFPIGCIHLVFHRSACHYTWNKLVVTIHNIIVGKLWVDNVSYILLWD